MRTKSLEPMCVGCRQERFAKTRRNLSRASVEIEPAFVKMANLDSIEAIDFAQESLANRCAENEKRMRCKRKHGLTPARSQLSQIGKRPKVFQVRRPHVQ